MGFRACLLMLSPASGIRAIVTVGLPRGGMILHSLNRATTCDIWLWETPPEVVTEPI